MRQLNIVLITLACLTRLPGAQGDDDDDCEFIKSVSAKLEAKNLDFSMKNTNYPRDYCANWSIIGSRYDVITIDVPALGQLVGGTCKNAYLKLADEETEVTAKVNSHFLIRGPHVSVTFRPNRCFSNFTLVYRSSVNHEWTDGDFKDDLDNDYLKEDNDSSSIGRIIGIIVGCLLAVLLLGLCVLVITCVRRRRTRRAASGDGASVHFWSKPSGYTQATDARPSTSTDAPHEYDPLSVPASHKSAPADAGVYPHNMASNYPTATAPVPPPYSGHSTSSRTELAPFSTEPPPSYTDAVQGK